MVTITLSGIITLLPFVIMAIIYLLLLHPYQRSHTAVSGIGRSALLQPLRDRLKIGTRVVTKSGIVGCIAKVDEFSFVLETYDGSLIEMQFSALEELL